MSFCNKPFPSCFMPRDESEAWYATFLLKRVSFAREWKLIFIWKVVYQTSLSFWGISNSVMAYWIHETRPDKIFGKEKAASKFAE